MPRFDIAILRKYASKAKPEDLPPNVYLWNTEHTVTIFDKYPKAKFHLLVLPRVNAAPFKSVDLKSLKTLLNNPFVPKETAKLCMQTLSNDAIDVKKMIEDEMQERFGFKWPVLIGFHAIPSLEHIHLHVISEDFVSESLKTKKHYNSFHPKVGFFLHIDEVLSWFDAVPSFYDTVIKLQKKDYEDKLKEDLQCFRCDQTFKNIPSLKDHLEREWERLRDTERVRNKKKSSLQTEEDVTMLEEITK